MNYKGILAILALLPSLAIAQRTETQLKQWRFTHEDKQEQKATSFDDRKWQQVSVPHDWAISGPFDKEIDKQVVAIEQNGEKEATEKTGRSGSLPWIGCGWYRTHVSVNPATERAILNFDGAMAEPKVYVNGVLAGEWRYGYNTFNIDITKYLNKEGADNVIAVRLENMEESSRWYPGAGIYRPVTLITTGKRALAQWGVGMATEGIAAINRDASANVDAYFSANVEGDTRRLAVRFSVLDPANGDTLYTKQRSLQHGAASCYARGTVKNVVLWSPENPFLYPLVVELLDKSDNMRIIDRQEHKVGFRTVSYSAEGGFQLNGVTRKFKGVCLHHDLGMLGSAINRTALLRQLELLKHMGCDAIRTSHNMPSQMQMALCDSLGMMVMAESFDMWEYPKCKNGYARFFNEKSNDGRIWAERDIENLVLANRLHPSIVMWSIGNEIPEQSSENGPRILRHLQDIVHINDPDRGRAVTTGMDRFDDAVRTGFGNVIDIAGMNYRTHRYQDAYKKFGQGFILGSETASTLSSRGVYKFPVERLDNKAYDDGQCSSYDVEATWWANVPEDDWTLQDDKTWVIGEFVWTGFDYLGEPTPYDEYWPSRSSYFGILDLAGLPKDRYWLYRSRWNTEDKTIHLLPHWTWPGREGEITPVYCYTNYPKAELFVNGVSQGVRTKNLSALKNYDERITDINDSSLDRYRLRWNDVRYEPGEIKVVVYDANGKACGEEVVRTASAPRYMVLTGDLGSELNKTLHADGEDLLFITVNITDKDGNLCPDADNQISIDVKGAAKFRGICNGDATSLEPFVKPTMKAFHGQLVFAVQSNGQKGKARISVKSKGLPAAVIDVVAE